MSPRLKFLFGLNIILGLMGDAMATTVSDTPGDDVMTFRFNGLSYAASSFSIIDNRRFTLTMRGQTGDHSLTGFGIFEGALSDEDMQHVRQLREGACALDTKTLGAPRSDLYLSASLICADGRRFNEMFNLVGLGEAGSRVVKPVNALIASFARHGEASVKVDASAAVTGRYGKLLVTLTFSNTGHEAVAFTSPAEWEGTFNPIAGDSSATVVGSKSAGNADQQFFVQFGGEAMLNRQDYPDGVVRMLPGQQRIAQFLVWPDRRFVGGRYTIGGSSFIGNVIEPKSLAGRVNFTFKDTAENLTAFPATQHELTNFESYRRQQLFDSIHGVGDRVEEPAYYRAFGEGNRRDDFPVLLKKGEKFPERMMEHQAGGSRKSIGPATIWRWEAYPDSKVSALTGEPCPRSGYWVPDMPSGLSENGRYMFSLAADKRSITENEVMPRLGLGNDSYLKWTWLGDVG